MQNEKSGSRDAGWTPQKRAQFLRRVWATGQVRAAVAACGLSAQSVYKLRRRDPAFARRWDAALARCHARRAEALASVYADFLHRAGEIAASRMRPLDPVNSINPVSTDGGPQLDPWTPWPSGTSCQPRPPLPRCRSIG